jgi:hypothetical protein
MIVFRNHRPVFPTEGFIENPENVGLKVYLQSVAIFKSEHGVETTLAQEAEAFARDTRLSIRMAPSLDPGTEAHLKSIREHVDGISQTAAAIPAKDQRVKACVEGIQRHIDSVRRSLRVIERLERLQLLPTRGVRL